MSPLKFSQVMSSLGQCMANILFHSARGYEGPKADIWSLGVILYAMLAGNLPFEQELASCKRFRMFCKWVRDQSTKGARYWESLMDYPVWLFPSKFSLLARSLICAMLHPDPEQRISVDDSMQHSLLRPMTTSSVSSIRGVGMEVIALHEIDLGGSARVESDSGEGLVDANSCVGVFDTQISEQELSTTKIGDVDTLREMCDDDDDGDEMQDNDYDDDDDQFMMEEDDYKVKSFHDSSIPRKREVEPNAVMEERDDFDMHGIWRDSSLQDHSSPIFAEGCRSVNFSKNLRSVCDQIVEPGSPSPSCASSWSVGSPSRSSLFGVPPPAPLLMRTPSIGDLIVNEDIVQSCHLGAESDVSVFTPESFGGRSSQHEVNSHGLPPNFSDLVKRSTRFLTAVPAAEVLDKVESFLELNLINKIQTPGIGLIGRVELRECFRLEVWGSDTSGPPLCALQLYQIPTNIESTPPFPIGDIRDQSILPSEGIKIQQMGFLNPSISTSFKGLDNHEESFVSAGLRTRNGSFVGPSREMSQDLFLVEFVRGNLEIFAFKRFYQW